MSATDLVKFWRRHAGDAWKGRDKIIKVFGGDRVAAANAGWQALRDGDVAITDQGWLSLLEEQEAEYTAADIVRAVVSLNETYPNGVRKEQGWSQDLFGGNIPGHDWTINRMIEHRAEDAVFGAELVALLPELPEPWGIGISFAAAQYGWISVDALDSAVLPAVAIACVRDNVRVDPNPWPAERWGAALAKAALDKRVKSIEDGRAIVELARFVDVGVVVQAAHKLKYWTSLWDAIDVLGTTRFVDVLQSAVAALTIKAKGNRDVWPPIVLVPSWLRACADAQRVPDPALDPQLGLFFEHYRHGWTGSSFQEHHDKLHAILKTVPAARLEALCVNHFHPMLATAAGTAAAMAKVVEQIAAGKVDHDGRSIALPRLGPAAAPALITAVLDPKSAFRIELMGALADTGDPAGAPALASELSAKTKGLREAAIAGLVTIGADPAVLADALNARRKDTRLAAARVLARLPLSAGVASLASARLETEKVGEIIKILEALREQPEAADDGFAAQLIANDGEGWEALLEREDGGAIYLQYMIATHKGQTIDDWRDPYKRLMQIARKHDDALSVVVLGTMLSEYELSHYLDRQAEEFDVVGAVAEMVAAGIFERPAAMGENWAAVTYEHGAGWLMSRAPERAPLADLLGNKLKVLRLQAVGALIEAGNVEVLHAAVSDKRKNAREVAALGLERLARPESVPVIEAALATERARGVKQALESALTACRNASLDVTGLGIAELDALLAGSGATTDLPLVPLTWSDGTAVSEGAAAWLGQQLQRETLNERSEQLATVVAQLGDASAWADAIIVARGDDRGVGLYCVSVIGAERHVEHLGKILETLASSQSTSWGTDGCEVLYRNGSPLAVRWLDHWHRKTRRDALRHRAIEALQRLATDRGTTVEDLVDEATPDFGFDISGEQRLDYGPRTLVARLDDAAGVVFIDETGKQRTSLPAARKADDADRVAAIKTRFKGLKRDLKRILTARAERLERAMASGHTWPAQVFAQRFVDHPIARSQTGRLVFLSEGVAFCVTAAGTYEDVGGNVVDIQADVAIAHPIDLDVDAWRARITDKQPFPQLSRTVFTSPVLDERFWVDLNRVPPSTFGRQLSKLGWERGPREDAGLINVAYKHMGDLALTLQTDGWSPDYDFPEVVEFEGVSITRDGAAVKPETLPPAVLSEVVRDLYLLSATPH